jgi:hypothetical protein
MEKDRKATEKRNEQTARSKVAEMKDRMQIIEKEKDTLIMRL